LRLALNCVGEYFLVRSTALALTTIQIGGKETTQMSRLLGSNAHLVSYGAMSKQPLSLPTSLFIFKNLTTHGFWQSRWYLDHSAEERQQLFDTLAGLISRGQLKESAHRIVKIERGDSDEDVTQKVRSTISQLQGGQHGKKVLLQFEGAEEDVD
jgi:mitochondrial enoyl-[acyl-carrier protein] reductase / trans-2-enoyl-CoA reductase